MAAQTIPFPIGQGSSEEKELLNVILDNAHVHECAIHGKNVMTVLLTRRQIDRLNSYSIGMANLDDGQDAEQDDAA